MLFSEAAKRGVALLAVAVAAPIQAGMWGAGIATGSADSVSTRDHYGVRLLDTELAAPVLPAPTTATEQRPLVAEPSTGSATAFSAERALHARLEQVSPSASSAFALSHGWMQPDSVGALAKASTGDEAGPASQTF